MHVITVPPLSNLLEHLHLSRSLIVTMAEDSALVTGAE